MVTVSLNLYTYHKVSMRAPQVDVYSCVMPELYVASPSLVTAVPASPDTSSPVHKFTSPSTVEHHNISEIVFVCYLFIVRHRQFFFVVVVLF